MPQSSQEKPLNQEELSPRSNVLFMIIKHWNHSFESLQWAVQWSESRQRSCRHSESNWKFVMTIGSNLCKISRYYLLHLAFRSLATAWKWVMSKRVKEIKTHVRQMVIVKSAYLFISKKAFTHDIVRVWIKINKNKSEKWEI